MISHTCDTAQVFTKVIEVENWVPNLGVSSREVVIYCDYERIVSAYSKIRERRQRLKLHGIIVRTYRVKKEIGSYIRSG